MQELDNYVIKRIKTQLNDVTKEAVVITLTVNLSYTWCNEERCYFSEKEDLLDKTDEDLLHNFEMLTQTHLNHVADWYLYNEDLISITLRSL